jgi:hypothetical protein
MTSVPVTTTILDPTGEQHPVRTALNERPPSLDGRIVGLLDITKARGNIFLDRLEERCVERGWEARRFAKPTFTKPAPADLRYEISQQCDVVIEALAD